MNNLSNLMKQAQEMQAKMQEMQEGLVNIEVMGTSGGGMVSVTLNGKGEMRKIDIDKSAFDPDDMEMLEDLIVAAFNDAKSNVETRVAQEMSDLTKGLQLPPGFNLPF